jgi:hypothetical protein
VATNFPAALDALRASQGLTDGVSIYTAAPHNNLMDAVDALQAKVGVANSAVPASLDYQVANKGAFVPGAVVFNTHLTAGSTWQDLDLSAVVGAQAALVFLEVTANTIGVFTCKPKGYGGLTGVHTGYTGTGRPLYGECGTGAGVAGFVNAGPFFYVMCITDSAGVIQIAYPYNTTIVTIKVIGFFV